MLCARHPDVEQTALLFKLRRFHDRPAVRKEAVFEPDDEHHRELQPLGRMQRHEGDGRPLVIRVLIGNQGRMVQEVAKLFAAPMTFFGGRQQFADVLDAALRFFRAFLLQDLDIPGRVNDLFQQRRI